MAVAHKSVISFGSWQSDRHVRRPGTTISVKPAHMDDSGRVRQKRAPIAEKAAAGDIVKGMNTKRTGMWSLPTKRLKNQDGKGKSTGSFILSGSARFRPSIMIRPMAVPEPGGEKAFELLRSALMQEQKVAVGKRLSNQDTLMAIIPGGGVLISTMFSVDEVRELPKTIRNGALKAEMDMAKLLITLWTRRLIRGIPRQYGEGGPDQTKLAGREVTAPRQESAGNVIADGRAESQRRKKKTEEEQRPEAKKKRSREKQWRDFHPCAADFRPWLLFRRSRRT